MSAWQESATLARRLEARLREREAVKDKKLQARMAPPPHPVPAGQEYWRGLDASSKGNPLLPRRIPLGTFELDVPELRRPRLSWSEEGDKFLVILNFAPRHKKAKRMHLVQLVCCGPYGAAALAPKMIWAESFDEIASMKARHTFTRRSLRDPKATLASFEVSKYGAEGEIAAAGYKWWRGGITRIFARGESDLLGAPPRVRGVPLAICGYELAASVDYEEKAAYVLKRSRLAEVVALLERVTDWERGI